MRIVFLFQRLLLFLFSFTTLIEAKTLHSIIVCDTFAHGISHSVKADLKKVREEIQIAANHTGLSIQETLFSDHNVNEEIIQWLEESSFNTDDVVFLFFSGHGYRTVSKIESDWPNLYFTPARKGVDFYRLIEILEKKNPRLIIAIADCCNNVLPEYGAPPKIKDPFYALSYKKPSVKKNYRSLFLKTKGKIIASSSIPGQHSWGTKIGGLFTVTLFHVLKEETKRSFTPSWDAIFHQSVMFVHDRALGQTPQFELSLD